jgi:hypothetical protein
MDQYLPTAKSTRRLQKIVDATAAWSMLDNNNSKTNYSKLPMWKPNPVIQDRPYCSVFRGLTEVCRTGVAADLHIIKYQTYTDDV